MLSYIASLFTHATHANGGFFNYRIERGNQYCNGNRLKVIRVDQAMHFKVMFDRTAMYENTMDINQHDINKLWGFSEGWNNHDNSARVGWNYYRGHLYLRPYTYVHGFNKKDPPKIRIQFNHEVGCSIYLQPDKYLFMIDGFKITMPRGGRKSKVWGLQQYPYFGGDEVAAHNINVFIKTIT